MATQKKQKKTELTAEQLIAAQARMAHATAVRMWKERALKLASPRRQQAHMVEGLLTKAAATLKGKKAAKATLADYIKLVQLQKDLTEDEEPRDIKVGWVDKLEKDGGE